LLGKLIALSSLTRASKNSVAEKRTRAPAEGPPEELVSLEQLAEKFKKALIDRKATNCCGQMLLWIGLPWLSRN
jgi:hypothetical protein